MIKKSDLKLVPSSDPILHTQVKKFDFNGDIDAELFSNIMHEKMKEYGGIGLAANQVGVNLKMFVRGVGEVKYSIFNPTILDLEMDTVSMDEGCLSFPGIYMKVSRPKTIHVEYQNVKGEVVQEEFTGLTARIFLHEYDHMMGITFDERVSKMKWDLANNRKQKRNKKIAKSQVQKLIKQIKEDVQKQAL